MKFKVQLISLEQCKDWFLNKHYAQRIPNRKKIFGIFDKFNTIKIILK